jgi:hypothetical protein
MQSSKFDFSNIDINQMNENFQKLNNEMKSFSFFLNDLSKNWKDDKKKEFFKKYFETNFDVFSNYLIDYKRLVDFIEQAKNTKPKDY